jgi:hypothetical protein
MLNKCCVIEEAPVTLTMPRNRKVLEDPTVLAIKVECTRT